VQPWSRLLERENATILNAAILATARRTIKGFKAAVRRLELSCPLYLPQNDGTLIDAEAAAQYRIKTFASGPTNSMTGAAFLAGLGKPQQLQLEGARILQRKRKDTRFLLWTSVVRPLTCARFCRRVSLEVGGVRTAFSMPEIVSIGLGGGSKIVTDAAGNVTVGPNSVSHYLMEEALIFGGPTLTASDVVVASGKAQLGDPTKVSGVPQSTVQAGRTIIKEMLESVIEQMKVSAAPVHVLFVGGGSLLVTEDPENSVRYKPNKTQASQASSSKSTSPA
jgi:N-methylhydantoinase A/oxoprolinase/acetone carboxylase beta subunit